MINAVLAIEDRRYYDHPGVDPIRLAGAMSSTTRSGTAPGQATSTITQQLVRNVFLPQFQGWTLQTARDRSKLRKLLEIWVSLVMTSRATKDEILEMYLNTVPLGQRGSFAIIGVSEAARLFFGKDVSNLSDRRGGDDRRRHSIAVGAVALQQSDPVSATAATW